MAASGLFGQNAARVKLAFGHTTLSLTTGDTSRVRGFMGKICDRCIGRSVKAHIRSHHEGGGRDVTLVSQRYGVNRSRSRTGRSTPISIVTAARTRVRAASRACALLTPAAYCIRSSMFCCAMWGCFASGV